MFRRTATAVLLFVGACGTPSTDAVDGDVLDAPMAVTATAGDASATVTWTAPDGEATSFTVTSDPGGLTASATPPATTADVSGLTNGTAYTFTVVATNDAGDSDPSAPSSPVTPGRAPAAPTAVTATAGHAHAIVSWTPPTDDGGFDVTDYTITSDPAGGTATAVVPSTSVRVDGLTDGTAYTFTVVARNAKGTSTASAPSNAVTPGPTVPGPPISVAATPADAQAMVTWTAPFDDGGKALTLYTVTSDPGGFTATATPPDTGATVTGLTNGTAYTFTVVATNELGDGPPSAPSTAVTPAKLPGAPTLTTFAPGNTVIDLAWSAPDDGGSPITGYIVEASPGGVMLTLGASVTSTTLTGLDNAVPVAVTVAATNAIGEGPPTSRTGTPHLRTGSATGIFSAGATHSCALNDGVVSCWGDNTYGQLGTGSYDPSASPKPVVGLPAGVEALSLGDHHSCALTNGGEVWCWGRDDVEQLGRGTAGGTTFAPGEVHDLPGPASQISAGAAHTCALVEDEVWCWGHGVHGQMGDGVFANGDTASPVLAAGAGSDPLDQVQSIGSGGYHTCAVRNGGATCWGHNDAYQIGDETTDDTARPYQRLDLRTGVSAVAAGRHHTCVIQDGALACWGSNAEHQAGGTGLGTRLDVPSTVVGLSDGVTAVSAGDLHTCAIRRGALQCFGRGASGELGRTTPTTTHTPAPPVGLADGVQGVEVGATHTCALRRGQLSCWGQNSAGQVGDGGQAQRSTPYPLPGFTSGVQVLSAHGESTCALVDGDAWCWGGNSDGQLGDGTRNNRRTPVRVPGVEGAQAIDMGEDHACALVDGTVWCWGANDSGQLGNGTYVDHLTPVRVLGLAGVAAISAGDHHTCAIADGSARCWGDNADGQVGDGSTDATTDATTLPTGLGSGVQALVAGSATSCAIQDGALTCWGDHSFGSAGVGTGDANILDPTPVSELSFGLRAVAMTAYHGCALGPDGVSCWGFNFGGQVGDGTTDDVDSPVTAVGLTSGALAVATGARHTCARDGFDTICWGSNFLGQLGDGSFWLPEAEVLVLGSDTRLSRQVVAGAEHTCALADGSVACWGANTDGQLGVGAVGGTREEPTQVVSAAWP